MTEHKDSNANGQARSSARTEISSEQRPNSATVTARGRPSPVTSKEPTLESGILVGTLLEGRYFLEKELGKGGVGIVYLARDRKLLDKRVVVKVLLEKSLRFERILQKFHHEKEALTRVDHPGIVGILDTGELPNGKPYIVMQFVDGVPLRAELTSEGMDLERVADIIRQLCEALAAAHDKGIFHRDLKPENIMLQGLTGGRESVKIIDFGIAKVKDSIVASSTVTPMRAGTYWYMSPEQFRAERVTAASDVYSLGVIAYEMVTGRRPFNAETVAQLGELFKQGVKIKPKDLRPSLPEAAQDVILKALSLQPEDRYQNACHLGEAFERALSGQPYAFQEAVVSSTSVYENKPRGKYKKITTGVAIVALLLITGLTLSWNRFGGSTDAINSKTGDSIVPGTERSLTYWLNVQKMRDGKPYQQPFQSSGQEIFESGYKFQMNVSSPHSGYLYMLNESADAMSLTLIYPTPKRNNGSAGLLAGQPAQTGWNVFQGEPGTEQYWMVWSPSALDQFEAARSDAFMNENGAIRDAAVIRKVREFLTRNAEQKPEVKKDPDKSETILKANSAVLVYLMYLEHR